MQDSQLFALLDQIQRVSERGGFTDLVLQAESLRERLEHQQINVAVLGQFKRGKSALVNALLGEEVLPTSVIPLTAVPTFVRHGAKMINLFDHRFGTFDGVSVAQRFGVKAAPIRSSTAEHANPSLLQAAVRF